MQWRFNLLPMLQDFEDMKAAFSAKQIIGKTAYTYRGSAKDTQRASNTFDYLGVPMTFEKVVEHSCKAVVRVKGFGASPNRFTLNPLCLCILCVPALLLNFKRCTLVVFYYL